MAEEKIDMISIFIPTYNGDRYIGQTIDSLLTQTYSDFEVVCVDDASTDETVHILTQKQQHDSRIRVYSKAHEGDVPHAWQYVFPLLRGSHTLYMSQDDVLDPDSLQKLVERQQQTNADTVIPTVVFWEEHKNNNEVRKDCGVAGDTRKILSGHEALSLMMNYTIPGFALWNTSLIRTIGMRTEAYNSDEVAQREWIVQCKTVAFSDAVFRFRRDNPNSITQTFSSRLYARPLSDARLVELASHHRINPSIIQPVRNEAFSSLWWYACHAAMHRREYSCSQWRTYRNQFKKAYRILHTGASPSHSIQRLAARNGLLFCLLIVFTVLRTRLQATNAPLRRIALHGHLVVTRKEKYRIVRQLTALRLQRLRWRIYKLTHHIHHPVVHYYAVCWNEERFLPFMLEHYRTWVDHFHIYDNGSTDNTLHILSDHPQCSFQHFDSNGFNDRIHIDIKNECWKKSRGKADYVIVCDIDELLYHPNMVRLLDNMRRHRYSIVKPQGYDMYHATYPAYDQEPQITAQIKTGIRADKYSKCILFDPYRIVDIHYEPGCHQCHPTGIVHYCDDKGCKLLHYKNLGLDYLLNRTHQLAARLSDENLQAHYGCEYLSDEQALVTVFQQNLQDSQTII